jgi:hypothetical protein
MSGGNSRFDARRLSLKLRQIASELRRSGTSGPAAEHLAHRLERHAEAMLRPEGGPEYRPFDLRAERLGAR